MVRRRAVLAGAAGLALALALYVWMQQGPAAAAVSAGPPAPLPAGQGELPRIGLERLSWPPSHPGVGRRDIFDFGSIAAREDEFDEGDDEEDGTPRRPARPVSPQPVTAPLPSPPTPVELKYIGTLDAREGLKVAFFLTDQKEVLTGRVGDTLINRWRIARIGLESVDLHEVATGQVRRVPLRGN